MKVCKKCKKKSANKSKICKYCGADISSAKVVKTKASTSKTSKSKKEASLKIPAVPLQKYKDYTIHHTFNYIVEKENKQSKLKSKVKDLEKTTVLTFKNVKEISKKTKNKVSNVSEVLKPKKDKTKKIIVLLIVLLFLLAGLITGISIYKSLSNKDTISISAEKATKDKIFDMKDTIDYDGVLYKVTKVETSKGNSYKKPKDGNQFLIVTIQIKNNTDKKVPYSYANWTMSNSKKEEKKRIFSSINVDTALYSGELVIGGLKTGSIVFEQPINDPKLVMNYYELKKDDYGNDVADQGKRIFSISINVQKEKTTSKTEDKEKQENKKS